MVTLQEVVLVVSALFAGFVLDGARAARSGFELCQSKKLLQSTEPTEARVRVANFGKFKKGDFSLFTPERIVQEVELAGTVTVVPRTSEQRVQYGATPLGPVEVYQLEQIISQQLVCSHSSACTRRPV
jgi:hypothetical protein